MVRAEMARKKRSDEIADLRARLRSQTDLLMEAEPLLPVAQALQEAIQAKLADPEADGIVLDVDAAWDAAVAEVAQRLIATKLDELEPELVLELYARSAGDAALAAALERWAAAKTVELELQERIEQLRRDVSRSGALDLERLEPETRIEVGMFDPAQISQARKDSAIPPTRTLAVRLLDPHEGYVEVISDSVLPRATEGDFSPNTRGKIGSEIVERGNRWLEPRLQVHAPLGYDLGSGTQRTRQVIGFVEIGDGLLLVDAR
jgi:hypothetical protein